MLYVGPFLLVIPIFTISLGPQICYNTFIRQKDIVKDILMSHKIYEKKGMLVMEVPLWQSSYDAIGEFIGHVPNLIGIVAGHKCSISQLIDLAYKAEQQEGGEIINFDYDEVGLRKVCKELGISIWNHDICEYCGQPVRGSCTWGDEGLMCDDCDLKNKK